MIGHDITELHCHRQTTAALGHWPAVNRQSPGLRSSSNKPQRDMEIWKATYPQQSLSPIHIEDEVFTQPLLPGWLCSWTCRCADRWPGRSWWDRHIWSLLRARGDRGYCSRRCSTGTGGWVLGDRNIGTFDFMMFRWRVILGVFAGIINASDLSWTKLAYFIWQL